jgi:hypothetical protein
MDISGLDEIVLEESYVLGIEVMPGRMLLRVDFVLTVGHALYRPPASPALECTRRGEIFFHGVTSLDWSGQGAVPARDRTGELDYGHIDSFEWKPRYYQLEGDWGFMRVHCGEVEVRVGNS